MTAIGIAATNGHLYALRDDGSVFVLRAGMKFEWDGTVLQEPYWAAAPAVPGTEAAKEQEG